MAVALAESPTRNIAFISNDASSQVLSGVKLAGAHAQNQTPNEIKFSLFHNVAHAAQDPELISANPLIVHVENSVHVDELLKSSEFLDLNIHQLIILAPKDIPEDTRRSLVRKKLNLESAGIDVFGLYAPTATVSKETQRLSRFLVGEQPREAIIKPRIRPDIVNRLISKIKSL